MEYTPVEQKQDKKHENDPMETTIRPLLFSTKILFFHVLTQIIFEEFNYLKHAYRTGLEFSKSRKEQARFFESSLKKV